MALELYSFKGCLQIKASKSFRRTAYYAWSSETNFLDCDYRNPYRGFLIQFNENVTHFWTYQKGLSHIELLCKQGVREVI